MSIIDVILSNPLLLIAIIFGLISFLGRMAKGFQQSRSGQSQTQTRTPSPQGQEEGQVDWRDIFRQEEQQPEPKQERPQPKPEPEPTSYAPSQPQASQERDALYDRLEEVKQKKREAQQQVAVQLDSQSEKNNRNRTKVQYNFNQVTGKEAMKAVVWAEVLGNPRSRNPHTAFNPKSKR